jgi:L-fuculose-phosphate aldolase
MAKSTIMLKKDIVEIGRRVYQRGYVAANDGNISVKTPDNRVLITPTGVSKGFMDVDSMVVVTMDGKQVSSGPKASSELGMHLAVYRERDDVNAIVHAHPPFATAFGIAEIPLTQAILPEVVISLGAIPLIEYGTPGTEELCKPLIPKLKQHDAFLLQNHGALALGPDLTTAYFRMETLEHFAHIAFNAYLLGKINTLSESDIGKLLAQRREYGFSGEYQTGACIDDTGACSILQPRQTYLKSSEPGDTSRDKPSVALSSEELKSIIRDTVQHYLESQNQD